MRSLQIRHARFWRQPARSAIVSRLYTFSPLPRAYEKASCWVSNGKISISMPER